MGQNGDETQSVDFLFPFFFEKNRIFVKQSRWHTVSCQSPPLRTCARRKILKQKIYYIEFLKRFLNNHGKVPPLIKRLLKLQGGGGEFNWIGTVMLKLIPFNIRHSKFINRTGVCRKESFENLPEILSKLPYLLWTLLMVYVVLLRGWLSFNWFLTKLNSKNFILKIFLWLNFEIVLYFNFWDWFHKI